MWQNREKIASVCNDGNLNVVTSEINKFYRTREILLPISVGEAGYYVKDNPTQKHQSIKLDLLCRLNSLK